MARVFVKDTTLTDIADAIREKNGSENTYKPSQMADAVRGIESGGDTSEFGEYYWIENLSKKTNLNNAFSDWTSDRIPEIDVSNAINTSSMFANSNIAYVPPLDLKSCTNASSMFSMGWKGTLESIEVKNTSKVTSWSYFCYQSTTIKTVKTLDLSSATSVNGILDSRNIETLLFVKGTIKISLSLKNLALLTAESIQSVIDGLADLTGKTAQTLTLHADVKAKLTEAQISQITSKNWTLA